MNNELNNTKEHLPKEVDLLSVLSSMGRGIGSFFNTIGNIFISITKEFLKAIFLCFSHWKFMIWFVLLGIIIGSINIYLKANQYSSTMIVQSNALSTEELEMKIMDLNGSISPLNPALISRNLNISQDITKHLTKIKAYWFYDKNNDGISDLVDYKENYKDTRDSLITRIPNRLLIKAVATNIDIFEKLDKGIIHFLNNDARAATLNKNRLTQLKTLQEITNIEIKKLDSLQAYEYFKRKRESTLNLKNLGELRLSGEEKDPKLMHEDILNLVVKKQMLEKNLEIDSAIVSVYQPMGSSISKEGNTMLTFFFYIFIFTLIGYLFLLLRTYRQSLIDFVYGTESQIK